MYIRKKKLILIIEFFNLTSYHSESLLAIKIYLSFKIFDRERKTKSIFGRFDTKTKYDLINRNLVVDHMRQSPESEINLRKFVIKLMHKIQIQMGGQCFSVGKNFEMWLPRCILRFYFAIFRFFFQNKIQNNSIYFLSITF